MKKLLSILILAALPTWCAQITISDTLRTAIGSNADVSSISISWPTFVKADGHTVLAGSISVVPSNGQFTATLEASDTSSPEPTYTVTYVTSQGNVTQHWIVNTPDPTNTVLKVKDVAIGTLPVSLPILALAELSRAGGVPGDFLGLAANGPTWLPAPNLSLPSAGLLKSTGTGLADAAASDVVTLFGSGSCSGYLKSDGTCDTPTGSTVYPGAGIAISTGTAWSTSLAAPTGSLVGTGQANAYSTGLQDFSAATEKLPTSAGYAPTSTALFGYDSTANKLVFGNGTQTNVLAWLTGSPTSGDCVKWGSNGQLLDQGAPCGSGTGGGMTNPMTTAGDMIIGGTSGAAERLAVGTSGQVLTVVSGAPAWAAAPSGGFTGTAQSIPFVGSDGSLMEDNANLNYDDTNHTLTVARNIVVNGSNPFVTIATNPAGTGYSAFQLFTSPGTSGSWDMATDYYNPSYFGIGANGNQEYNKLVLNTNGNVYLAGTVTHTGSGADLSILASENGHIYTHGTAPGVTTCTLGFGNDHAGEATMSAAGSCVLTWNTPYSGNYVPNIVVTPASAYSSISETSSALTVTVSAAASIYYTITGVN